MSLPKVAWPVFVPSALIITSVTSALPTTITSGWPTIIRCAPDEIERFLDQGPRSSGRPLGLARPDRIRDLLVIRHTTETHPLVAIGGAYSSGSSLPLSAAVMRMRAAWGSARSVGPARRAASEAASGSIAKRISANSIRSAVENVRSRSQRSTSGSRRFQRSSGSTQVPCRGRAREPTGDDRDAQILGDAASEILRTRGHGSLRFRRRLHSAEHHNPARECPSTRVRGPRCPRAHLPRAGSHTE